MKIEKEISFVNFHFWIEIEMRKNALFHFNFKLKIKWYFRCTNGLKAPTRSCIKRCPCITASNPCIKRSFDFQLNFLVENWILTLFLIQFNFQFKIENSLWNFKSIKNRMNVLYTDGESVYRKYDSFYDLKTKQILKVFHFSFVI